jgi:hypothetical protein
MSGKPSPLNIGLAIIDAGPVGLQVQLRRYAVRRVDHAAQPRHEERVHDGRRSQGEMHRHANRHDESAHLTRIVRLAAATGPAGSSTLLLCAQEHTASAMPRMAKLRTPSADHRLRRPRLLGPSTIIQLPIHSRPTGWAQGNRTRSSRVANRIFLDCSVAIEASFTWITP